MLSILYVLLCICTNYNINVARGTFLAVLLLIDLVIIDNIKTYIAKKKE